MKTLYFAVFDGSEKFPPDWEELNYFSGVSSDPELTKSFFGENEVVIYNLDSSPHRSGNLIDLFQRKTESAIKKYFEYPSDIVVVGHTPLGEKIVRAIRQLSVAEQPVLILRFSTYYGEITAPYPDITSDPKAAGYDLDLFKDYNLLHQLVQFQPLADAIAAEDKSLLSSAICQFNQTTLNPLIYF